MKLIDENGDLFGVVNVLDALVILLVLIVVVAGIAVVGVLETDSEPNGDVNGDDAGSIETQYATIDVGTQSTAIAETISEGDEMTTDDEHLAITDVYAVPTSSEHADVTVRVELDGTQYENGTFEFGNDEFTSGQNVSIQTDEYDVTGTIDTVEDTGTDLETTETEVLFEQTVDQETAEKIQASDEHQLGTETIATVDTAAVYPVADDQYRVVAGVTLTTLEDGPDDVRYGPARVEPESTITFATDNYTLEPEILETGTTTQPGEETTTTVEIDLEELEDREADQFEPGLTETMGDNTWATITDVDREPASIIVETDDGDLHEREHPTRDDLTLTVELQTHETDLGMQFQGEELRNGDTVSLDFGVTTIEERAWIVD